MPAKTFNVTETTNDLIKFTQRWFQKTDQTAKLLSAFPEEKTVPLQQLFASKLSAKTVSSES